MTSEKREAAIKWLKWEIRSLERAPEINGCPMTKDWAEQLEIMKTCLEAVTVSHLAHIDREAWKCPLCERNKVISFEAWEDESKLPKGQSVRGGALFCPHCGKPRTPEAWAELEKRMGVRA